MGQARALDQIGEMLCDGVRVDRATIGLGEYVPGVLPGLPNHQLLRDLLAPDFMQQSHRIRV